MSEREGPKRRPRANELHELIHSGRLPVGSVLVHVERKKETVEATVVAGGVKVRGRVYPSVSTAARAVAIYSVNGWNYWKLAGTGRPLSDLRRTGA